VVTPADLRQFTFLAALDEAALADVLRQTRLCEYRPGEHVLYEGEQPPGLFLILRGRVRLSRTAPDGREQVLAMLRHGAHFDAAPLFDHNPNIATARAMSQVACLLLPREALLAMIARHPPIALALMAEMAGQLRELVVLVEDLAFRSVRERLVRQLLREATEGAADLTQQELAERTGTVREIAGRALRQLAQEGLVKLERGRVRILNQAGLAAIAEG